MPNRLQYEKSPYLLQHKDNPVDWYPWGKEAFDKARLERKPIFLSIGYATCHWCHVMEHDSFEKQEVADVLNRYYVSIKLDREERPDIDHIYMDAVVAATGRGGWPMSVFLTEDLKPFFGGTFFWKDQFLHLLHQIRALWQEEPEKIKETAEEMMRHLSSQLSSSSQASPITKEEEQKFFSQAASIFKQNFDPYFGGFGPAPKFPRSIDVSLLLRMYHRSKNPQLLSMAELTLEKMALGGMYDHLGGGFHRYSTDAQWLVPHFEKMLYDNALLSLTYLEAYQLTGKKLYASVARETLDYVLSRMTHPEGGFYSAEDADSEGVEGKYYVWSEEELKHILSSEELTIITSLYGVTSQGNFSEGGHSGNILNLQSNFEWSAKELARSAHQKMLAVREKRIPPLKDDKILTSWNGLMIAALAKGFQVLGDGRYLVAAQQAAHFIKKHLVAQDTLLRRYREGEARFEGVLEDYAYFIYGLLHLYETDFDSAWYYWILELQKQQDELFWSKEAACYFNTRDQAFDVILRKKETFDGATPSAHSVACYNLAKIFSLTGDKAFHDKAYAGLYSVTHEIHRYPPGMSMALIAFDFLDAAREIVVVGDKNNLETKSILNYLNHTFIPEKILLFSESIHDLPLLKGRGPSAGETSVFICEHHVCRAPLKSLAEVRDVLEAVKPLKL